MKHFKRKLKYGALGIAVTFAGTSSAHAGLPTEVSDAFAALTSSVGDYTAPAFALVAAVLTLFIGIKWFKRVANRAS